MKGDAPNQRHTYQLNQKVKILTYMSANGSYSSSSSSTSYISIYITVTKKRKGAQSTSGLGDGGVSMILAVVTVRGQRCDLLKCLLKLGYRFPGLELIDEYNPLEALGAAKVNH